VTILLLIAGLEFPVVMALVDAYNRPAEHFTKGEPDKRSWIRWLWVAVATVPVLVGYGIVLGYHETVVKRNRAASS
jgi:hypothetical protein